MVVTTVENVPSGIGFVISKDRQEIFGDFQRNWTNIYTVSLTLGMQSLSNVDITWSFAMKPQTQLSESTKHN